MHLYLLHLSIIERCLQALKCYRCRIKTYTDVKWTGKNTAVVSSSLAKTAALRANYEVKTSLAFLGANVLAQPEVMLSEIHQCFDENGNIIEATKEYLQMFVEKFVEFIK